MVFKSILSKINVQVVEGVSKGFTKLPGKGATILSIETVWNLQTESNHQTGMMAWPIE